MTVDFLLSNISLKNISKKIAKEKNKENENSLV